MKLRSLFLTVIIILVVSFSAQGSDRTIKRNQAAASGRTALVIGNSLYPSSPLKNPVRDADAMAKVLEDNGFSVTLQLDADHRTMERAIRDFGRKLRSGGAGLFYFAGHGMQVAGRNYLVPVDATIESESDIRFEAVDAGRVLGKMEDAGNGLNIVILDACRDNPFGRSFRSAAAGLARMDAPTGSFIAYATRPGSVAADGTGLHSPFTGSLLQFIREPGLTIEQLFKKVRGNVIKETGRKQVPWESSSLVGQFIFHAGERVAVEKNELPVPVQAATPVTSEKSRTTTEVSRGEEELWHTVKDSESIDDLNYYITQYPHGVYGATARLKVKRLEKIGNQASLTVETEPSGATVRILNIKPSYQPGMKLAPGRYHIEVSAEGYKTKDEWLELEKLNDLVHEVELESLAKKLPPLNSPPPTIPGAMDQLAAEDVLDLRMFVRATGHFPVRVKTYRWSWESGDDTHFVEYRYNTDDPDFILVQEMSGKNGKLTGEFHWRMQLGNLLRTQVYFQHNDKTLSTHLQNISYRMGDGVDLLKAGSEVEVKWRDSWNWNMNSQVDTIYYQKMLYQIVAVGSGKEFGVDLPGSIVMIRTEGVTSDTGKEHPNSSVMYFSTYLGCFILMDSDTGKPCPFTYELRDEYK